MGLFFVSIYLFATLVRPQELYLPLAPYNLMDILAGLAVAGATLDTLVFRSRPSLSEPQVPLLLAFIGWAAFSLVVTLQWFGGALRAFEELSVNLFVFLALVLSGTSLTRLRWLRGVLLGSMMLLLAIGLNAYAGGPWEEQFVYERHSGSAAFSPAEGAQDQDGAPPGFDLGRWLAGRGRDRRLRALGFLNDPNDLAQLLVALLPMVFVAWRRRQPFRNTVFVLLPAALFLYATVLTSSRGGFAALGAVVWFAVSTRYGGRFSRIMDAAGWTGLLLALVLFFRFGMADDSAAGRREAWSIGLGMLRDSPVWGAGFGAYGDELRVAHNSYVHCFGELGLVGYGLWLGAMLVTLRQLDTLRHLEGTTAIETDLSRWGNALRLSLMAFLVSSLFLSRSYSVTLFVLLGLPTALAGVARRRGFAPGPRYILPFAAKVMVYCVGTVLLTYVTVRLLW